MGAGGAGIHPGEQGRTRDGTDRGVRVGAGETDAFFRQLVEVWRMRLGAAVATEVGADVLAGDPEDVRAFGGLAGKSAGQQCQEADFQFHHRRCYGLGGGIIAYPLPNPWECSPPIQDDEGRALFLKGPGE